MIEREDINTLLSTTLRRFLYDNFYSTETMNIGISGTGYAEKLLTQLTLATGMLSGSYCRMNYNFPCFNPYYSTFQACLSFDYNKDVFAFFGFKKFATEPAWNMTESHAGFMLNNPSNNGMIYTSTANDYNQERIPITELDPKRKIIYRIELNKFSYFNMPVVIPYFDGIEIEKLEKKWSVPVQNANYLPLLQDHYLVFYIENKTNQNRYMLLNKIIYTEKYAD